MKKIIVLFLIFSIINLYGDLYAKERRGVNIEIYKVKPKMESTPWDTPFINGELIAVKRNSLLLLDSKGADVSVNVADIREIKIVKSSKTTLGIGLGFLGGAAVGILLSLIAWEIWAWAPNDTQAKWRYVGLGGAVGGLIGAGVGGIIGSSHSETIQIEGKTDTEIKKILDDLSKKARVPNVQ